MKQETISEILKFRDDRDWKQFHNPKDLAISICLEAAELLEVFQWSAEDVHCTDKMDKIREELADVLCYSVLMADACGLDMDEIVREKVKKNNEKYPVEKALGSKEKYTELKNCKKNKIALINASCAEQKVDAVVNAANNGLWAGGGICGVIFKKAGLSELTSACSKYKTPLKDGTAVITPAFKMTNTKHIIHAVGPDFSRTPKAFKELFDAYYNSLKILMDKDLHSIAFPLISSGIFGGSLSNPVAESTKQCCKAYLKFIADYPDYAVDVKLCAFMENEMREAKKVFDTYFN